ncbi:hypothetical protein G7046_g8656 [Stylonectria norvegica]|nr:hypothetical protein G7046_g8656 [Stylonectria norvegica]
MQSAGLRQRASHNAAPTYYPSLPISRDDGNFQRDRAQQRQGRESGIPRFVINLSQAPETRYDHIIPYFKDDLDTCNLSNIFHDLLRQLTGAAVGKGLGYLARIALHRLYDADETAELRGISKAIGVAMHIMVAFNVLLDLLLGCTSGGVRVFDPKSRTSAPKSRVLHFRTLDWGMDEIRKLVVELDYVRFYGGPVVASTVTYLGYVGVLTGVKKGLSMSLNFRPYHARDTWRKQASFRWHQMMVVLGFRQSISSVLRHILLDLPGNARQVEESDVDERQSSAFEFEESFEDGDMESMLWMLSHSPSTAAYLIFCRPDRVFIVEKDHHGASIRSSNTFLTAYNHDAADESDSESDASQSHGGASDVVSNGCIVGMANEVGFSLDRKCHLDSLWTKQVRRCRRRYGVRDSSVTVKDVLQLVKDEEISNEETHYAVVMDPQVGQILWRKVYDLDDESESS